MKRWASQRSNYIDNFLSMYLALEGTLQPSLFQLSLAAILFVFLGGSRSFDTTTASTTCLMMDASSSVLLWRVCMTRLTIFWSHHDGVQRWLQLQSTALNIEDEICVSTVIDNAKALYRQAFHQADHSVGRYRQMRQVQHQDYELAPYVSTVKIFKNRRVVSKFRCGCHGLHVDTGEFKPIGQKVDREQRFCLVCASDTTEDEHHFVFDCPAYCSIRDRYTAIFRGPAPTLSSFFTLHDPRVIAKFLHECFAHRSRLLEGILRVPQH